MARETGAGLELSLELHPSMLTAAAAASALDALYGEVAKDAGVPQELRDRWRDERTPRYAQIYETLRRGFVVKASWRDELKWFLKSQRDAALHAKSGGDVPQPHPLGTNTAPEYVLYTCESACRAVDLMLDVLATCVARPRSAALTQWAKDARTPVENLIAARRGSRIRSALA